MLKKTTMSSKSTLISTQCIKNKETETNKASVKLTTQEVLSRISNVKWNELSVPGKNKGGRGQLLQLALGIPNNSSLTDLEDGELKSYTIGQTICITQLKHCLCEIIDTPTQFKESKLGIKLEQTIYIGFQKDGTYKGSALLNKNTHPTHYNELVQDYNCLCDYIRNIFTTKEQLTTFTGPNKLLQIRTKASRSSTGNYTPLVYKGHTLKNKYMAFYMLSRFGKNIL